jgi:hypothetical protein
MNSQAINALTLLKNGEHTDIIEYIKTFNGERGFMYTLERDPKRIEISERMSDLLNSHGNHSGASWGCMLRLIQALLLGKVSIEELNEEDRISDERYKVYCEEQNLKRAQQAQAAQIEQQDQEEDDDDDYDYSDMPELISIY